MFDNWELLCAANRLLVSVPKTMSPLKNSYPTDLPEWYTEEDEIIGEIFPEDLFFNPYISVKEEMKQLEKYEDNLECYSDDESDEVSDYEWETIKNKV
jgi:hypothetical protein